jgi:plastocyanin
MTQNNKTDRMKNFIQNNKNILIAIVAIIIVVLLAVFLTGKKAEAPVEPESTETVEAADTTTEGNMPSATRGEAVYKAAIAEHEGRLVTVVDGCVAEPKTQEVALGEHVLLVNASKDAHSFTVGTETYAVGERHYKTLRLKDAGEYKVSCDDTKDIATIIVK